MPNASRGNNFNVEPGAVPSAPLVSTDGACRPSRYQNLFADLDPKGLYDFLKSRQAGRSIIGRFIALDLLLLQPQTIGKFSLA